MAEAPDLMTLQASQSLELSSMYSSSHFSPTGSRSFWTREVSWVWKDRREERMAWRNWKDMKLVEEAELSSSSRPLARKL